MIQTRRHPAKSSDAHRSVYSRDDTTPPITRLLDRLESIRQTGPDSWIARCPAHDDRSPSLSISTDSRAGDGRVLVRCHAECAQSNIVAAVGMTLADLFPRRVGYHLPPRRYRIPAADRLAIIDHEALAVGLIAADLARGVPLTTEIRDRLLAAAASIGRARDGYSQ